MVNAAGADSQAIEAPTRLAADCAAHRLVGCSGGRDNCLRLGIFYATDRVEPGAIPDRSWPCRPTTSSG